jgi:hypothetical protein
MPGSRPIPEDSDRRLEGRKGTLKDNDEEGLQVTATLEERISERLVDKILEQEIETRVVDAYNAAQAGRVDALERQREFLLNYDEFVHPIYESATDWGSRLQMPTVFTMCKTFHARFVSAILASDPTAKARKEANVERAKLVEELFRYTLREWMNEHTGIDDIYDELLWDWVTAG